MGVVLTGVIILIGIATLSDNIWASNKLAELEAQTMSIVSFEAPTSELEPKFYKLDNNRFRLVWWKSIATEVLETNPLLGLGFGYDLAAGFLREYDQDLGDEFTARSPHCVVFTALGRLGLVGFVIWITFCGLVTMRAWKAMRHGADTVQVGLWCVTIVMLVSATFGVVLEGPMGAVIFWSALGLATAESQLSATEISPEVPEPLPNAGPSASV